MKKIFRELISVDQAVKLIIEELEEPRLGKEEIDVYKAVGRVLAEDITAEYNVPPFSRSMRDGYAVRYQDVSYARETNPVKLRVIGISKVGVKTELYIREGEAVEIDTGAMVPGGANAIVMEEYTERRGDELLVYKSVGPGEFIQQVGADKMVGEKVIYKNTVLGPRDIGAIAAVGIRKVKVYRKPVVGIISTGDEIIPQGEVPRPGEIFDVNGPLITSILTKMGINSKYYGIAKDDPVDIYEKIVDAMNECDVIITSGSTSVGTRDILYKILEKMEGSKFIFHGVKQKPGRPTMAVKLGKKLLLGLPGFPVSALMIFYNIVYPVLMYLMGYEQLYRDTIRVKLANEARGRLGVTDLIPVIIKSMKNEYTAYPITSDSGAIITLTLADGYIKIPENQLFLEKGEYTDAILFGDRLSLSEIIICGSHSIALNKLIDYFIQDTGLKGIKRVWMGSNGVFESIRIGYGDLGGTHLFDPDTNEYNVPFVEKYGLKNIILYRGFQRMQGLVVAENNPKGIRSIEDIISGNYRFINRSKGSGTRQLIDLLIREYSDKNNLEFSDVIDKIDGYYVEAKTHDAVVTAIEMGHADVGVAIKTATVNRKVDFIPISREYYDILVSKKALENNNVSKLLEFIFSDKAKEILMDIPGIAIDDYYGHILIET
jgi:putative molybdopterin biosynthesis protein